jgi:hypothetical protein
VKLPNYDQYQPLVVEWRDAFHDFDHNGGDPFRPEYKVKTTGFYIGHDTEWLHITQEILPDGDGFRGVTHLPLVLLQTINGEKV